MMRVSTVITIGKETYEKFVDNSDASEDIFNYIGIMPGPQVNGYQIIMTNNYQNSEYI